MRRLNEEKIGGEERFGSASPRFWSVFWGMDSGIEAFSSSFNSALPHLSSSLSLCISSSSSTAAEESSPQLLCVCLNYYNVRHLTDHQISIQAASPVVPRSLLGLRRRQSSCFVRLCCCRCYSCRAQQLLNLVVQTVWSARHVCFFARVRS